MTTKECMDGVAHDFYFTDMVRLHGNQDWRPARFCRNCHYFESLLPDVLASEAKRLPAAAELLELLDQHARPLLRVAYLAARGANDREYMARLEAADEKIGAIIAKATGAT